MSSLTVPSKTPLGHDELRHRTLRLGQRYRTVLLLVDGHRPLAEVLGMAYKAGAQTSHLEELVRLGLVELPSQQAPVARESAAGALGLPQVRSFELDGTAQDATDPPAEAPTGPQTAPGPGKQVVPEIVASPLVAQPPPAAAPAPALESAAPELAIPEPHSAAPAVSVATALPLPAAAAPAEPALEAASSARPATHAGEESPLEAVRQLLLATLRRDARLFRAFAPARVLSAETQHELIELVWEIERERGHARRTRDQLLNLQRARELLGMGNTMVAADSIPAPPDEH